jgi:type I restriction enzyme S subunit
VAGDGRLNSDVVAPDGERIDWEKALLCEGDLLFARSGATVGKTYLHRAQVQEAVYAGYLIRFQLDTRKILPDYAFRYTQSFEYRRWVAAAQHAVAQPNINAKQFAALPIPLPPLDEQRRIAAVLDQAESLRRTRVRVLRLMRELIDAVFMDMFGGDPNEMISLSEAVAEFRYGTSVKSTPAGYPVLRIPNVVGGALSLENLKFVEVDDAEFARLRLVDGDLLFVRTNGNPDYVGRCAVYEDAALARVENARGRTVYASYLIRARLHESVSPAYLAAYLNGVGRNGIGRYVKTSAGQYNINIEGLGKIPIPKVPRHQQEKFVHRTLVARGVVDNCLLQLKQLDVLFTSLQSRAFRGELSHNPGGPTTPTSQNA